MGFNGDDQLYFADWGSYGDFLVLKIYLDEDVWNKYPQEKKNALIPRFIRRAIAEKFDLKTKLNKDDYLKFVGGMGPTLGLVAIGK